jgi:hypothetical protein
MPYIGNNPKVTELNVSTKSVDILADVDTVSDAPEIGQVLKWNGTNWVPEDDTGTGGGGGATTSDLQGVTDNGSSTTNTIDAAGFKLNADQLSSVAGTQGDIKKIGGLPYYHDGTAWKRFYLFDNVEDATTVDVNWDDVQVRFDFEPHTNVYPHDGTYGGNFVNHVNGAPMAIETSSFNHGDIVNSPVKFGTSSFLANSAGNSSQRTSYWNVDNETLDIYTQNWKGGKRGGGLNWSLDWTMEFWIYFPQVSPMGANQQWGYFTTTWFNKNEYIGLRSAVQGASPNNILWYFYINGQAYNVATSSNATIQSQTWHHIVLQRDASAGTMQFYLDGTYYSTGQGTIVPNIEPFNSRDDTYILQARTHIGYAFNSSNSYAGDYYLDDFRLTQYARYTPGQNFTPPTAAYPIAAPAPAAIDDNWSDVQLRATFDTNLNDTSQNTFTGSTSGSGTSAVSTQTIKYGASSLYCPVNDAFGVLYGSTADFAFLTNEWTFESWINFDTLPAWNNGTSTACIFSFGSNFGTYDDNIEFGLSNQHWDSTNNDYKFILKYRGAGTHQLINLSPQVTGLGSGSLNRQLLDGRWNHVALTKENTNNEIQLFINGYKIPHTTGSSFGYALDNFNLNTVGIFSLGGRKGNFSWGISKDQVSQYSGITNAVYFDDVRMSDYVRYTENFTPPTGPLGTTGSLTTAPTPASSGEGSIALGTTPGWNGTTGWTVQRSQAGIYRVTFPGTFASSQSYVVHTTINDGPTSPCHVRVTRYASYFDIVVTQISDGTAVDTGYVGVRLLDLATV